MRLRLLPPNPHLGWTPYAWLIYLPIFVLEPLSRRTSALEWGLTAAAVAVFLVLYFVGHWVKEGQLLLVTAALFALGAAIAPWNVNSSVFIIYASAFAGRLSPPRRAMLVLAAILALIGLESWALALAWPFWVIGGVFSLVVGAVNMHFHEAAQAAARLRESQAQVEQLVRIAERERIARDLHDLLGHTLTVIALKAELAGKLVTVSPERAAAEIRDVEQVTRDALREVRGAIAGYRSEGLPAELARARLALETAGVRPEYFTMPVKLPAAAEAALALAVREAVTNIIRHAAASTCRITLEPRGEVVVLEVADDGRGGAREGAGSGTGLLAMRERLSGLGGRLELRPAAWAAEGAEGAGGAGGAGEGRGTRLVITVPLRAEAPAEGTAAAGQPAGAPGDAAAAEVAPANDGTGATAGAASLAAEPGR
jgi:two-component system sensor histidine kinase DesK